MADRLSYPLGRKPALLLVRELMNRPFDGGRPRSQRYPVLVLEGPWGTGKSAVLTSLTRKVDQRIPFVLVDFDKNREASPGKVLAAIVDGLGRRCGRFATLQFPRFTLAQLAMSPGVQLSIEDDAARAQMTAVLRKRYSARVLRDLLKRAADGVMVETTTLRPCPDAGLVERLSIASGRQAARLSGRLLTRHERYQSWYQGQDVGLDQDPVNELIELHRSVRDADLDLDLDLDLRIIEVLCGAFLADLRDDFANHRLSDEWSLNCLLLLDHVDLPAGRRFLAELVRCRSQRLAHDAANTDPLTVVAASQGDLLADLPGADQAVLDPDEDTYAEHRRHRSDQPEPRWLRYVLPNLTEAEIYSRVTATLPRSRRHRQLTAIIEQVCGGHPEATRLFLEAVSRLSTDGVGSGKPEASFEPERILSSGPEHNTVEERLVRQFLADVPAQAVDDLITAAAARDSQQALQLAAHGGLLNRPQISYPRSVESALWHGDQPRPSLLRWLLLRRLATRPDDAMADWSNVHNYLRDKSQKDGREADELHYALADRDLVWVTARLTELLREDSAVTWLRLLSSVTAAPDRQARHGSPFDQIDAVARLADTNDPIQMTVARLVAGLWILADPLTGPQRRAVHQDVAAGFSVLAPVALSDGGRLRDEENRHRVEAGLWD